MRIDSEDFIVLCRHYEGMNFSDEGLEKIFDVLEDTDSDNMFDLVALRCQFTEYTEEELIETFLNNTTYDEDDYEDENEREEEKIELVKNYLERVTLFIDLENGNYIVEEF